MTRIGFVPTEAATLLNGGHGVRCGHEAHGFLLQHACAAAGDHARVSREVRRRGEKPRVAGDAAHAPRGGIMHDTAEHHAILIRLRGRDARLPVLRRQKTSGRHAERAKDLALREFIQRRA